MLLSRLFSWLLRRYFGVRFSSISVSFIDLRLLVREIFFDGPVKIFQSVDLNNAFAKRIEYICQGNVIRIRGLTLSMDIGPAFLTGDLLTNMNLVIKRAISTSLSSAFVGICKQITLLEIPEFEFEIQSDGMVIVTTGSLSLSVDRSKKVMTIILQNAKGHVRADKNALVKFKFEIGSTLIYMNQSAQMLDFRDLSIELPRGVQINISQCTFLITQCILAGNIPVITLNVGDSEEILMHITRLVTFFSLYKGPPVLHRKFLLTAASIQIIYPEIAFERIGIVVNQQIVSIYIDGSHHGSNSVYGCLFLCVGTKKPFEAILIAREIHISRKDSLRLPLTKAKDISPLLHFALISWIGKPVQYKILNLQLVD